MLKLLKIEWFILSKSKIFWIIISLCFLSMTAFPYVIYTFKMYDENTRLQMLGNAFSFPIVFNTISVVELFPVQLICIYFIAIICNEFEIETFRLQIQAGISKTILWKSKVSLSLMFILIATVLIFLLSLIFGFINDDEFDVIMNLNSIKSLILFLFQLYAYLSFATTLALIIKKSGPTIIIYILWFGLFERLLAQIVNGWFGLYPLGALLPGKSVEELSYLQAFKGYFIRNESYELLKTCFAIIWVGISTFLNYYLFKKAKY